MKRAKITNCEEMVGETFLARRFRAIGERPWRWFKIVWFAVFVLLLPLAFVGFESTPRVNVLPPPESIPYVQYLKGGTMESHQVSGIPSENIPEYDPTKWPSRRLTMHAGWDDRLGRERLIVELVPSQGQSGWPYRVFAWTTQVSWDVTDHSKPFVRRDGLRTSRVEFGLRDVCIAPAHSNGAGITHVWLHMPGVFVHIVVPLLAAFALVCPLAMWYRIRQGRRRARNACLRCGHQRDPDRQFDVCGECGRAYVERYERPAIVRWRRRRRTVTMLTISGVLVAWVATQASIIRTHDVNFEQSLESMSQFVYPTPRAIQRWYVDVGWPRGLFTIIRTDWFAYDENGQPVPTVRTSSPARNGMERVRIAIPSQDQTARVAFYINPNQLVLQLTLLFYIIVLLAAIARWRFSRRMRKV